MPKGGTSRLSGLPGFLAGARDYPVFALGAAPHRGYTGDKGRVQLMPCFQPMETNHQFIG